MGSRKKINAQKKENRADEENRVLTRSERSKIRSLKIEKIEKIVDPIGKRNRRNRSVKSVASIGQSENVEEVLDAKMVVDDDESLFEKSISNSFKKPKAKSTGFQLKTKSLEQLSQTTELNFDSSKSDTMRKNAFTELKHNLENIEKFQKKLNKLNVLPNILDTEDVEQSTVPIESVEVVDNLSFSNDFSFDYLHLLINQEAKINKRFDICIKDLFCQLEIFNAQIIDLDLETDSIIRHLMEAVVDLRLIHIPLLYFFHYLKLKGQTLSMSLINSMLDNYKTVVADRIPASYVSANELLAIYYVMLFHYRNLYPNSNPNNIDRVFQMMISLIEPFLENVLFSFSDTTSLGLFIFAILCAHKLNLPFENRINHIEPFASIKRLLLKIDSLFSYNCYPEVLQQLFNNLFTSIVINKLDSFDSLENCDLRKLLHKNLLYTGKILTSLILVFPPNSMQNYLIFTFFQLFNIINLKSPTRPMESIVLDQHKQYFQLFPFTSDLIDIHCIIKLFFMISWGNLNDETHLKCAIDFVNMFLSIPENFHPKIEFIIDRFMKLKLNSHYKLIVADLKNIFHHLSKD